MKELVNLFEEPSSHDDSHTFVLLESVTDDLFAIYFAVGDLLAYGVFFIAAM